MKRHHCTLVIYTDDTEDEKYCLDDCPLANLEGWPHDCDYLKIELELDGKVFKSIRDKNCPWKSFKVVEDME